MFALLTALAVSSVAALPSPGLHAGLAANIAYRSPSLTVRDLEVVPRLPHSKRGVEEPLWDGNLSFPYGVASGDPYSDSVILWTVPQKVDAGGLYGGNAIPVCLDWFVSSSNETFSNTTSVQNGRVHTTQDVGYSVKVEAVGLQPYTEYYYRFQSCVEGGEDLGVSPIGRFKTLPAEDDEITQLRLAVFSCSNMPFGYFNAYGHAANNSESLDYVQHVGDYIYEYQNGVYGDGTALGRAPQPDREISSLQDYRDRYAQYRKDPDLQELHRVLAWQAVWDDHEIADNSWNEGSANSNETLRGQVGDYKFSERKANAVRAWYEWLPSRQVDTDDKLRIWRSFKLGKMGTMIMLDTRNYERSITDLYYNTLEIKNAADDADRSLTGSKQQAWLYDELLAHQARGAAWPLIYQQIVFSRVNYSLATGGSTEFNVDAWEGYRYERDQILGFIEEKSIENTVILSGDSHATWVSDLKRDNATYNATTGDGALGVEFAGSAVSSPSSYGYGPRFTDERYVGIAANLTAASPSLQFAEGQLRGYFQLSLTNTTASADFYGFYDQLTRNSNVTLIGTFSTEKGSNKLTRPLNGGKTPAYGAFGAGGQA